jgi:hypothetical protein
MILASPTKEEPFSLHNFWIRHVTFGNATSHQIVAEFTFEFIDVVAGYADPAFLGLSFDSLQKSLAWHVRRFVDGSRALD